MTSILCSYQCAYRVYFDEQQIVLNLFLVCLNVFIELKYVSTLSEAFVYVCLKSGMSCPCPKRRRVCASLVYADGKPYELTLLTNSKGKCLA